MKRNHLYILLMSLSLVGYAWIGWNLAEGSATPTPCLFKAVTDLPCPSCGSTRAIVLLMNGEVEASLLVNPLGVFLALALMIVPMWIIVDAIRQRGSLFRFYAAVERLLQNKWIAVPAVVVIGVNWFWNIVKGL